MLERTASYHPESWRWHASASTNFRSITVTDESAETRERRQEQIKKGAQVVPFGFARVLSPEPVERDPQVWEGSD